MLTSVDRHEEGSGPAAHARQADSGQYLELDAILAIARRQAAVFIVCCAMGVALGVAYLVTAVPQYTATAVLLLDNRRLNVVDDVYARSSEGYDVAVSAVDSQVEVGQRRARCGEQAAVG